MRHNRFVIFILFFVSIGYAQSPTVISDEVYANPEVKASFPGGVGKFYEFVKDNFILPEVKNDIEAKFYVSFVITKDGSMESVTVIRDPGNGIGEETLRVMKLSPKWKPAQHQGLEVKSTQTLPLNISVNATYSSEAADNSAANGPNNQHAIYTKAEFPGGYDTLKKEFFRKFVAPEIRESITVRFVLSFTIDVEGNVTEISCIDDPGHGIGSKAIAAFGLINKKWKPATKNGLGIKSQGVFPVALSIEGGEGEKKIRHNIMRTPGPPVYRDKN